MPVSVLMSAVGFKQLSALMATADQRIIVPEVRKSQRRIVSQAARMLKSRASIPHVKRSIRSKVGRNMFAAVTFDPVTIRGTGKGQGFRVGWAYDNSPTSARWKRGGHTPRHGGMAYRWVQGVPPLLEGVTETELKTAGAAIVAALAVKGGAA